MNKIFLRKGRRWVLAHIGDRYGDHLEHHGIKGMKWGVQNGPPYPLNQSPAELSKFMKTFKYKDFSNLQSPEETRNSKSGSCHDQVMLEIEELRRMGYDPKALFIMEYNPKTYQGGMTHSLVYYDDDGKTAWFENAWTERQGINYYDNVEKIKQEIKNAHKSGEYGNISQYANIVISDFKPDDHTIGETLQDLVDICLQDD